MTITIDWKILFLVFCLYHTAQSAYPQDGAASDIIATGSEVQLNVSDDWLDSNAAYIDFGNLSLPSAPFSIEARMYWRGQTLKNATQTFFFYGTSSSFVWIGGVPQGSSSSSYGWLYIVVKNSTGVYSNPIGSFIKKQPAATWFVFTASFTRNNCSLYLFNWNDNYDLDPIIAQSLSFGFDPSTVSATGRAAYLGTAPAALQPTIQAAVGASSFSFFAGRLDEFRIFNTTRNQTDSFNECNQRLAKNRQNLVALWTIPETSGNTITDSVAGRYVSLSLVTEPQRQGKLINGEIATQNGADIVVTAVSHVLPADSGPFDVPVMLLSPTLISTVSQTTTNRGVDTCYMYGGCNSFPVFGLLDSVSVRSIRFTPSRSVCGTTQVFGFQPDNEGVFKVSLVYEPYKLNVIQPFIYLNSSSGGKIQLSGTFGSVYTPAATLDNSNEYVRITGGFGTTNLTSTVNSNGLSVTFPKGFGVAEISIKMCNQVLNRTVYYPTPVIKAVTFTTISGWDVFNSFQIHGSNFGSSRSTWSTTDITFYNGTTYHCVVQSNNETFISCQMPDFMYNGTSVDVTVNIGGLKTSYSAIFGSNVWPSASPITVGSTKDSNPKKLDTMWIIIIACAGSGCLLIALVVLLVLIVRRRKASTSNNAPSQEMELPQEAPPSHYAHYSFNSITDYESNQGGSSPSSSNYSPVPIGILTRTSSAERMILNQNWHINYSEIEFGKEIGKGAYGVVFKAVWKGVPVAVKQMLSELENLPIKEFFAEAELMTKLRPHPNITQILGVCESPPCLVTEYVHNGSLKNWLIKNELPNDLMVRVARGIAAGMMYLHSEGVIHRDLAARNILLDKNLLAKVSDFGMSRVALDNITNKTVSDIGPIRWMAPEAMRHKVYNKKTDIWSFGAVLYEIMTRKSPYAGYDLMQVAANVMMGQMSLVPEIEQNHDLYPPVMVTVLKECMRNNPEERPDFADVVKMFDASTQK